MKTRKVKGPQIITVNVGVTAVSGAKPFVGNVNEAQNLFLHPDENSQPQQSNNHEEPETKEFLEIIATAQRPSSVFGSLGGFTDSDEENFDYNEDVFSPNWVPPKFNKRAKNYGRPKKGSLTEKRGIEAGHQVAKEIVQLCEVIEENGRRNADGTVTISFGDLFANYVYISDKVVGMLLRARKHKMVTFEGEMLFQRRDENVEITLLHQLDEVRHLYAQTDDPSSCVVQFA